MSFVFHNGNHNFLQLRRFILKLQNPDQLSRLALFTFTLVAVPSLLLCLKVFLQLILPAPTAQSAALEWQPRGLPDSCSRWDGADRGFGLAEDAIDAYLKGREENMTVEQMAKEIFEVTIPLMCQASKFNSSLDRSCRRVPLIPAHVPVLQRGHAHVVL